MRGAGNFISLIDSQGFCPVSPDEAFEKINSMSVFLSSGFQEKKNKKKINVLHILKGNPVRNVSFKALVCAAFPCGPALEGKQGFSHYLFWLLQLFSDTEKGKKICKNHCETKLKQLWSPFSF